MIVVRSLPLAEHKALFSRLRGPFLSVSLLLPLMLVSTSCRSDISIGGAARSVSLFTAVDIECSKITKVDSDKAKQYEQAYLEAGKKAFGTKKFLAALETENARRIKEVKITGPAQWCAYQQGYLEKMGAGDVFSESRKTISTDDMATTLAYLVVAGSDCDIKQNNESLNKMVRKYCFDLNDFSPNGRYDPIMDSKRKKQKTAFGHTS